MIKKKLQGLVLVIFAGALMLSEPKGTQTQA